jgi:GNAT superfamily N-acetyltransferase
MHEWPIYRDLRLRALADSPDAFGSTLALEQGHADDHWAQRLAAVCDDAPWNLAVLALANDAPAGLAWGRIEPAQRLRADLYQMWVAPAARRSGAGGALLAAVIAWAQSRGVAELYLGVTCGDTPARRLYERAGFAPHGAIEPLREGATVYAQPMRRMLNGYVSQSDAN